MSLVRPRPIRRGAGGGTGLNPAEQAADNLLRPALELALAVAKAGESAVPPVPAPRTLRRFLSFARLPPAALDAVRRELDDDEGFRRRAAAVATESSVGRAGWLVLNRPAGWEDELGALIDAATEAARTAGERAEEHSARRRVGELEEAVRRAEAGRRKAEEALASERERTRRATADATGERTARRRLERELEGARRAAAAASEAADAARRGHAAAADEAAGQRARADDARSRLADLERRSVDRAAALDAIARVRSSVDALGRALDDIVRALGHGGTPRDGGGGDGPSGSRSGRGGRRSPRPVPPGVFDDTVEAAEHLVRLPEVVLLVDGYNASMARWAHRPVAEQRERLVDALAELASRTGADARVVFDGADTGATGATAGPRRAVRVVFSPPGTEADDVILDLVDSIPPGRPVVVASDDRRVRAGAAERGANWISTTQLAGVLRRES